MNVSQEYLRQIQQRYEMLRGKPVPKDRHLLEAVDAALDLAMLARLAIQGDATSVRGLHEWLGLPPSPSQPAAEPPQPPQPPPAHPLTGSAKAKR